MEVVFPFIFRIAFLFLLVLLFVLFVVVLVHMAYVYPRAGRIILETGYWPAGWRMMPRGQYAFGQGEPFYWHTLLWVRIPENSPATKEMGRGLILFGWSARFFVFIGICAVVVELIYWLATGNSNMLPLNSL